jgi:DNA polymerase III delta subunit
MDVNRTPATLVIWAVNDMARKLHAISRILKAGGDPYRMVYKLKLFGGSDKPFIETARTLDPGRALNILRAGIDADRRSKSGLADADRAAEIAVLRLPRLGARS